MIQRLAKATPNIQITNPIIAIHGCAPCPKRTVKTPTAIATKGAKAIAVLMKKGLKIDHCMLAANTAMFTIGYPIANAKSLAAPGRLVGLDATSATIMYRAQTIV